MAKAYTTSDQLKLVFSLAAQSDAKDWKRLSKKKNEQGQVVRAFENKKTGAQMIVTETGPGQFSLKAEDAVTNIALPDQCLTSEQKKQKASTDAAAVRIETDTAKIAAADDLIAQAMGEKPQMEYEDAEKLAAQAGVALANRYCFSVSQEPGDLVTTMITPIRFFRENGYCDDSSGPISSLLPGCSECMEATYEINVAGVKTTGQAARYLQSLGFVWDRAFQNFIDASQTAKVEKALGSAELTASTACSAALQMVFDGETPPRWLMETAGRELPASLVFTLERNDDFGGLIALVTPRGLDAADYSKKTLDVMPFLFPEAKYMDDCVLGFWRFPKEFDTPKKLAAHLEAKGLTLDTDNLDDEMKVELSSPAAKKTGAPPTP